MKLGAQLYSVRTQMQDEEGMKRTFHTVREIGYEVVQLSGASTERAEEIRRVSVANGLPITCTHVPYDRLISDVDRLIEEHRILECPVIGLGAMPGAFRKTDEGLKQFLGALEEPVGRIREAGLRFAYHNHDFEFKPLPSGQKIYDALLERCADWDFIADSYWIYYAGESVSNYLSRIGAGRLTNMHLKDALADTRGICACGDGVLRFADIMAQCKALGVVNLLVEQDNAVDFEDPFEQMARSYRHLRPLLDQIEG